MSDPGLRWIEVGVRSPSAEDRASLLVDGLLALGGRAAEERDGWYITHVHSSLDLDAYRSEAKSLLCSYTGLDAIELHATWREHEDWAETWKRGLGFRRITDRIAVRPSWVEEPDDAPAVVILLDPGMAFGTAEHGTTRGCLRLLDAVVTSGARVLDVGAGSGILAIAAALLGASDVVAIEGDALACEALAANLVSNRVEDRVRLVEGLVDSDGLSTYAPVDGVMANIESATLTRLLEGFRAALRQGGWLILSGILADEWPSIRDATEQSGFRWSEVDADGEWRAGLFYRA
ncbi:MAG: 50S ribosomal protein L11 methyltransferase [Gemmatimonadota bacterium]|nr:50S ribosomal protein L11 methyltransferase [Gemmatimonadota bacterium]MDH3422429.1 50S ribosomal protein L11 methyltransferase [Gemmatimonadota bacterium]